MCVGRAPPRWASDMHDLRRATQTAADSFHDGTPDSRGGRSRFGVVLLLGLEVTRQTNRARSIGPVQGTNQTGRIGQEPARASRSCEGWTRLALKQNG